jgi:Zn-dependent protease with chaperone function
VNVVEEISIASGAPVPEIFVLEHEQGINAFAAGLTPSDAAIAVTRGALERLTRSELQGVIAHEFSHILNGDMRLNQHLMGLSFGILVVSLVGRWLLRSVRIRTSRRGNGAIAMALGLGATLMMIGSIGLFFSRLIKAAVSRQREQLADASAVQFTRDQLGLAGALKKIGGYTGELAARNSEEVAHMLFTRGGQAFRGWFATHPPIDQRIQALDPSFKAGDYPDVTQVLPASEVREDDAIRQAFAGSAGTNTHANLLDQIGEIAPYAVATAMRRSIPESIDHAAHSRELSLLLLLALGLSHEATVRTQQLEFLERQLGGPRSAKCRALALELDGLDDQYRLPIVELSVPALRNRPAEQIDFVIDLLRRMAVENPEPRLFDFVLLRVLESYVVTSATAAREPQAQQPPLSARAAVANLLECVAAYGHADPSAALAAYRAGLGHVLPNMQASASPDFDPTQKARKLETLDTALWRLGRLRPKVKQRVLAGVLACIRHDHHIAVEESELFRAIAAVLGCPTAPAGSEL